MARLKQHIYQLLEPTQGNTTGRIVDASVVLMIVLNVLVISLETVPGMINQYLHPYLAFKFFSVAFFSLEYVLRLWTCVSSPRFAHPLWGRLRYAITPMSVIDLLALAPMVALFLVPYNVYMEELFVLSSLRLMRLFQLLRLARYSTSLHTMGRVLRSKSEELLVSLVVVFLLLVIASSGVYFLEHQAQPTVFSSIPASMWWAVTTLTTVGYGDMAPVTVGGQVLGGIIAVLGVGMFALPAGILASGFAEELQRRQQSQPGARPRHRFCPHCGESLASGQARGPLVGYHARLGQKFSISTEVPSVHLEELPLEPAPLPQAEVSRAHLGGGEAPPA